MTRWWEGEAGGGKSEWKELFFFFHWQGSVVKEWGISRGDYIELKFLITLSAVEGEEGESRVFCRRMPVGYYSAVNFFFTGLRDNKRVFELISILLGISEK